MKNYLFTAGLVYLLFTTLSGLTGGMVSAWIERAVTGYVRFEPEFKTRRLKSVGIYAPVGYIVALVATWSVGGFTAHELQWRAIAIGSCVGAVVAIALHVFLFKRMLYK